MIKNGKIAENQTLSAQSQNQEEAIILNIQDAPPQYSQSVSSGVYQPVVQPGEYY